MKLNTLSDQFAATAQLSPASVADAKAAGFTTIICNRPDGEGWGQPSAADMRIACEACGVSFHYVPMSPGGMGPTTLQDFAAALQGAEGRVLGYCRSGARSAMLYQAISG